jgi:multidrug transporter EmrE-like cation transporter
MAQLANSGAALVAFACLVWLLWPAIRDHPPSPGYAAGAALGTATATVLALVMSNGRLDLAFAVALACAALDLAGIAVRRSGTARPWKPDRGCARRR